MKAILLLLLSLVTLAQATRPDRDPDELWELPPLVLAVKHKETPLRPWHDTSISFQELAPLSLGGCAYDLSGQKMIEDPDDMGGMFQVMLAKSLISEGSVTDSMFLAMHDSISQCLERMAETDVEQYCIQKCRYRACRWDKDFQESNRVGRCLDWESKELDDLRVSGLKAVGLTRKDNPPINFSSGYEVRCRDEDVVNICVSFKRGTL